MSVKGKVQQIKSWFKIQSILSEDQKKQSDQKKDNCPVEATQSSTSEKHRQARNKEQPEGKKRKIQSGTSLTLRITEIQRDESQPWTIFSIWQSL
ncbi:hypothetical protein O181_000012 [Austropuccinia psidii MF-1]|uniref:Uncharacterized protein n=1 Tax=Austropuccinia psidii MF-1 TaxID=1389203 RepID=A0A9Q3B7W5_9BASI|nr:hypothetical protein [Austropuccinia psidii MF-1]